MGRIGHSRRKGRGGDEAHARDRLEPPALLALAMPGQPFGLKRSDPRPADQSVDLPGAPEPAGPAEEVEHPGSRP